MPPAEVRQIRERVQRALMRTRTPGFHFPGYLLDVRWEAVTPECSRLSMADGPHVRNAKGDVDLLAICVFADVAFGTAMRSGDGTTERLSTVYLQLQFTGVPARGNLWAEAKLRYTSTDTSLEQRLSSATLSSDAGPICHGTSAFLKTPSNGSLGQLPWQRTTDVDDQRFGEQNASGAECETMRLCDLQLASDSATFLEQFWLGPASRDAHDGIEIAAGAHIGNRVGHVQGGVLLGVAARAGSAAAPAGTRLSNISAWYLSPGRGTLRTQSEVLHNGRNTALVQTHILSETGELVLKAVTQHISLASAR